MRLVRTKAAVVVGAIALAVAAGAIGIFAVDDAEEAFAQIGGNENEVEGVIEALPAGGPVGTWQVAGRTVTVTEATRIDREGQALAVGLRVEVEGTGQPDGSLVASEIEVDDVDRDGDDDGGPAGATGPTGAAGNDDDD